MYIGVDYSFNLMNSRFITKLSTSAILHNRINIPQTIFTIIKHINTLLNYILLYATHRKGFSTCSAF